MGNNVNTTARDFYNWAQNVEVHKRQLHLQLFLRAVIEFIAKNILAPISKSLGDNRLIELVSDRCRIQAELYRSSRQMRCDCHFNLSINGLNQIFINAQVEKKGTEFVSQLFDNISTFSGNNCLNTTGGNLQTARHAERFSEPIINRLRQ